MKWLKAATKTHSEAASNSQLAAALQAVIHVRRTHTGQRTLAEIGVELEFKGKAEKEVAIVVASTNPDFNVPAGKEVVAVDAAYYRPTEVDLLIGDATKARDKLGWTHATSWRELCAEMVREDSAKYARLAKELSIRIN